MAYTNSSLITYTKISPNRTSPRNHVIDTITIHCMAGNLSLETCGNMFARSSAQASSNYGIDSDGRIAMYVEEKDRSWCSSNAANDHRSVTIEVANDGGEKTGWHVSDKAMASLIHLVTDICKRNGITELKWKADKSLIGQTEKQNMTVHRWFANKACPGKYLYDKHTYIAGEVNKMLGTDTAAPSTALSSASLYRVRKAWTDASGQIGAFSSLENAKKACKNGYSVFDGNGNIVYTSSSADSDDTSKNSSIPAFSSKLEIEASIKEIQTWLNTYYNTELMTDGLYGAKTKAALIKAWQTEIGGLTVDGIFGSKSQAAAAAHIIRKGSAGSLVTVWQAYLVCRGYNPNGIDSVFGAGCHAATIGFQRANSLTQDGIVGKNTWNKAFN